MPPFYRCTRRTCGKQQLTIRAANHLAAQDLYSALAAFAPELSADDEGRYWFHGVEFKRGLSVGSNLTIDGLQCLLGDCPLG